MHPLPLDGDRKLAPLAPRAVVHESSFTRAYAAEPRTFCSDCHAPELDPAKPSDPAVTAMGIGCVTCHVTDDGAVLAAPLGAPRKPSDPPLGEGEPHRLRRSVSFGGLGPCAGCHEFRFPGRYGDEPGIFMQTTVREHLASPTAEVPCARCHMPARDGRRSHAFGETRDPEWLRSKLTAVAARHGDHARITLEQTSPGHGFPTGDLFRRLEVGMAVVDEAGTTVRRERRYLARHFVVEPGTVGRRLIRDDRVFDEPVTLEFPVVPEAGSAIARPVVGDVPARPDSRHGPATGVGGDRVGGSSARRTARLVEARLGEERRA